MTPAVTMNGRLCVVTSSPVKAMVPGNDRTPAQLLLPGAPRKTTCEEASTSGTD